MMNPGIERESIEQYLARGGQITRVASIMPSDLVYVPEHEAVDFALGASYDDVHGPTVTRFNISAETMSAIQESTRYANMESDYVE